MATKTACRHCGKLYVNVNTHITKSHSWIEVIGDHSNWTMFYMDQDWIYDGTSDISDPEFHTINFMNGVHGNLQARVRYWPAKKKIINITIASYNPNNRKVTITGSWNNPNIQILYKDA